MSTSRVLPSSSSATSVFAWSLDELMQMLEANPHDAYLQYVALQLATRSGNLKSTAELIQGLSSGTVASAQSTGASAARSRSTRRSTTSGAVPSLLSLLSGVAAVQECLQLDAFRDAESDSSIEQGNIENRGILIADLKGPSTSSHPWEEMLGQSNPAISCLASIVPEQFLFIECRSIDAFKSALMQFDKCSRALSIRFGASAIERDTVANLKQRLALAAFERDDFQADVSEFALTTSDLFAADGSDITIMLLSKNPGQTRKILDSGLAYALEQGEASLEKSKYRDVHYTHALSADHSLDVFSAEPRDGLFLRSNSFTALKMLIDRALEPHKSNSLGESAEFRYVRTLMPWRDEKEDAFVYLSDAFVRRLVGAELRLSARRKSLCQNNLVMLKHAIAMFSTEYGRLPESIEELSTSKCAPLYNCGAMVCPDFGHYSIVRSGDYMSGACSQHGWTNYLRPLLEIPVTTASDSEAEEYKLFVEQYNQYWRTYFDPIAFRLELSPSSTRLETLVLPLIDNSIYTAISKILADDMESLDSLPVPGKNILSMMFKFNKKELIDQYLGSDMLRMGALMLFPTHSAQAEELKVEGFLRSILANQVGVHVYDSVPAISLDLSAALGMLAAGIFRPAQALQSPPPAPPPPQRPPRVHPAQKMPQAAPPPQAVPPTSSNSMLGGTTFLWISFLVASLNAPTYISLPLNKGFEHDADSFLERLYLLLKARMLYQRERFGVVCDLYKMALANGTIAYCCSLEFGPAKLRINFARIGQGIFISSKSFILNDLIKAAQGEQTDCARYSDAAAAGHAMARFRAANCDQIKNDICLDQSEKNRVACVRNLCSLSAKYRQKCALAAEQVTLDQCSSLCYCPSGGEYGLDGLKVVCSAHGSADDSHLFESTPLSADISAITAQLSFLKDGLNAVLTVDNK